MSLTSLVIPILLENLVRSSLIAVDQLMLYAYTEKAAAAMSTVNQFSFFIQLMYQMVAIGVGILISQNLGAKRPKEAGKTALAGFLLVTGISVLVSALVTLTFPYFLKFYQLEDIVYNYGKTYLVIYGGGSVFMAINLVQAAILRSYGFARIPMLVNTLVLGLNIIGNSIALFGPFGLPVFGVAGVAVSTVFSQVVASILMQREIRRRKDSIDIDWLGLRKISRRTVKNIFSVGIPTAGENLSYNLSQIVIIGFVAKLGTEALAAQGLFITISRYVFIIGISIGSATQIKVGHMVGAGQYEDAQRKVYGYFLLGVAISTLGAILLAIFRYPLIGLFTKDPEITRIAGAVLLLSLLQEPARNFNTIIIPALKGAGDVRFPVGVGLITMWAVSVFFAWLLGLHFALGLVGVWLGPTIDEWFRGSIMIMRWRGGRWKNRSFVAKDALEVGDMLA